MYLPKHFENTDTSALLELMGQYPFASVVQHGMAGLSADHLPLLSRRTQDGRILLEGHVARANPLWKLAGQKVMVVFQGPQAYVSPSWYPSKQQHGKVVPTWNYAIVHAHGLLEAHDDAAWLSAFLERLTQHHETRVGSSWKVSDAPADYLEQMRRAIVGISVEVVELVGKIKASQNRSQEDRLGIIQALSSTSPEMAGLIPK